MTYLTRSSVSLKTKHIQRLRLMQKEYSGFDKNSSVVAATWHQKDAVHSISLDCICHISTLPNTLVKASAMCFAFRFSVFLTCPNNRHRFANLVPFLVLSPDITGFVYYGKLGTMLCSV